MRNGKRVRFVFYSKASPGAPLSCDHPGCEAEGIYRAPRSRDDPKACYWFCLEHVRTYNRSWNYFADMTPNEIEMYLRDDVTGHRPTWPFGVGVRFKPYFRIGPLDDFLGLFADPWLARHRIYAARARRKRPASPQEKALAVMELDYPVARAQIKSRYKELVKRHHPDANGGSKDAEERLKLINQAYSYLMTNGF